VVRVFIIVLRAFSLVHILYLLIFEFILSSPQTSTKKKTNILFLFLQQQQAVASSSSS